MKLFSAGPRMRNLLVLVVALAVGVSGVALAKPAHKGHKPAHKVQKVHKTTGIAYVGVTHNEGDDVYVSGDFKDSFLGRGAIVYVVRASAGPEPASILLTAKRITFYTKRGSLSGTGYATVSGDTVTDGVFKLTKGTRGFKGHTFKGNFAGTYADGVYTFDYTGKYK